MVVGAMLLWTAFELANHLMLRTLVVSIIDSSVSYMDSIWVLAALIGAAISIYALSEGDQIRSLIAPAPRLGFDLAAALVTISALWLISIAIGAVLSGNAGSTALPAEHAFRAGVHAALWVALVMGVALPGGMRVLVVVALAWCIPRLWEPEIGPLARVLDVVALSPHIPPNAVGVNPSAAWADMAPTLVFGTVVSYIRCRVLAA